MTPFTLDNKKILRKASRERVADSLASIPKSVARRKWLYKNNRYRVNCTKQFESDLKANPSTIDHRDLTHYIIASAPTHAIDGWSYLGRSIDCTLRGDTYSAIHFAYYAELRAAMSLLASEGIGVFSKWHATIDDTGTCVPFPHNSNRNPVRRSSAFGTHKVVWPMLQYWSTLKRASDLLDELISPSSIQMSTWLGDILGTSIRVRSIAQEWLTCWGLDISVVEDDHDNRNLASYRPSEFRKPIALDVHEIVQFVEELWALFEPSSLGRFPLIEKHLIKKAWQASGSNVPTIVELEGKGLDRVNANEWNSFLNNPIIPLPLEYGDKKSLLEDSYCHLQVISRAALLLFLSTLASRKLLVNAAISKDTLSFWWKHHGVERALWKNGNLPNDPLDLWKDIDTAIADSRTWRN